MPERVRVLLVGSRVLPFRHAGDKNFWLDLIRTLPGVGIDVAVLSVTLEDVAGPAPYPCRYVQPIPLSTPGGYGLFNRESVGLRQTNNYPSKTMSFPRIVATMRAMERSFRPHVVHFIDNYGPVMRSLRPLSRGTPLTVSAVAYARRHPLYDWLLIESLRSFDCIVPFTHAFLVRLQELGFDGRLRWIPWGIDPRRFHPPSDEERASALARLGLPPDALVVAWSGFPQATGLAEMEFASAVAGRCLETDPGGFAFEFCFKPEHFDPRFRSLERAGVHVRNSAEEYAAVQRAADVLLSPFLAKEATVGPSLTWLEFMAMGTPVLSTPAWGVEDVIVDRESGLVAGSLDQACAALQEVHSDRGELRRLGEGARRMVLERFTVDRAAKGYADLWRQLALEGSPRRTAA